MADASTRWRRSPTCITSLGVKLTRLFILYPDDIEIQLHKHEDKLSKAAELGD